jgi:hypothetical protein
MPPKWGAMEVGIRKVKQDKVLLRFLCALTTIKTRGKMRAIFGMALANCEDRKCEFDDFDNAQ